MVSVCIASYNGEKYIKEQLYSILNQLSSDDEVIISDDGSSDDTLNVISAIGDKRIKIIYHKKENCKFSFSYTTRNFEHALSSAKGDVIFIADQDDIWKDNKVEICKKLLTKYDLILHDCEIIDKQGAIISPSYFDLNNSKIGIFNNIIKNSYLGCCMAFKKSVLEKAMPFPKQEVPHDIWIGLIAEAKGNVFLETKTLLKYRRHGQNVSFSGEKSTNSIFFKIKYRFIILFEIIKRLYL